MDSDRENIVFQPYKNMISLLRHKHTYTHAHARSTNIHDIERIAVIL